MRLGNRAKRLIAGMVATVAIPTAILFTAPSSQAASSCPNDPGSSRNASVNKFGDDYTAFFCAYGETLTVNDNKQDGYAAVVYVEMWEPKDPCCMQGTDDDDFVVDDYRKINLRWQDEGEYNIPEGHRVRIMVCRGYKSIPGDNCSSKDLGIA